MQNHHHNRVVLLFDMDCFYAQCERVRLGLPLDVKLCLFQWNSALAVTYPAREFGIKRGDSWDDVAIKMKSKTNKDNTSNGISSSGNGSNQCYTIHLPILGHDANDGPTVSSSSDEISDDSIEASYQRIFQLTKEQQIQCQQEENGRRRFHHQGKACLERYRLASMRIFGVVLESLQKHVTQKNGYSFVLERASIDEFYLDLTEYCYCRNQAKDFVSDDSGGDRTKTENDAMDKTVVAGQKSTGTDTSSTEDPLEIALNRACQVAHWIRQDIWSILGFTMSAGISTNKTMAKLAASYGKPNGQAVLYPRYFPSVLADTKIKKVRNFGGKLGKTVLKLLFQYQRQNDPSTNSNETEADGVERLKSTATMADLNQIPLPFLMQSKSLSEESARFVYYAGQGIDHEEVKETSGALVKSITAFKSFTATKSHTEIFDRWLTLLANEIVERVARDSQRNKRYPKSCTLNYTYYTTPNGQRPSFKGSTRSLRQSRSLRLAYPSERGGTNQQKSASLLAQAKAKLIPIVKDHPLRGVGLSASNFIASSVHQTKTQEGSIQSFFASKTPASLTCDEPGSRHARNNDPERELSNKSVSVTPRATNLVVSSTQGDASSVLKSSRVLNPARRPQQHENAAKKSVELFEDKDLAYARKLQASFDRENYALSTANRRRKGISSSKKNTQRIDNFFKKR